MLKWVNGMGIHRIDGKAIAGKIKEEVAEKINTIIKTYDITPTIATIMVGENTESSLYLRLRNKACEQVHIQSKHVILPDNTSEQDLLKKIRQLNTDTSIHGILVQLPLPSQISSQQVFSTLSPNKDVEGFHPYNLGRLVDGREQIIPCTPRAVLEIIQHARVELQGKHIVIVNHSMVVGKPLALLCLNRNATVTICHVFTTPVSEYSVPRVCW